MLASAILKQSAISETHLLVGISIAFIVISVLLLTRSLFKSMIILLPVLVGLVAMLAVLEMMGLSMSLLTVIAAIIVLALGSDYGIFAAYAWQNRETILGQGMASIHLSFLTTLVGTGVMLFAKHPALFVVSVSLTSGLLAAYLTAAAGHSGDLLSMVQPDQAGGRMSQRWAALAMLLLAPIAGCAAEPFVRPPLPLLNDVNPQAMRDSFADRLPARFTSDDTLIIQAPFHHDVAILGVLRVNRAAGTFEMVGLNQLGVQLFYLSGDRNGEAVRSAIGPLQKQKDVLLAIAQDIRRMYFNLVPEKDAKIEIDSTTVRFTQATKHGELVYEFGGDPAVLLEKRHRAAGSEQSGG